MRTSGTPFEMAARKGMEPIRLTSWAPAMSPLIISTPVGYMMIFALSPCLAKMPRSMPTKPGAWSLAVPAPILRSMGA